MPDMCRQFADFVVDNFVANLLQTVTFRRHCGCMRLIMHVTTNGAESYHGHLNAEFNAPHPNVYVFVEVLLRQQAATYVSISSLSKSRTIQRPTREKTACLRKLFTEYSAGLQTRLDYLRAGYQSAPSSLFEAYLTGF